MKQRGSFAVKAVATARVYMFLGAVFGFVPAQASLLFESGTIIQSGVSGNGLLIAGAGSSLQEQFVGARFEVSHSAAVSAVGGHISGSSSTESHFAAVVVLDSFTDLPGGAPFAPSEVITTTTFLAPTLSGDLIIPLTAVLEPGIYGLVFGGGYFGSSPSAEGVLTGNTGSFTQDILGNASYFVWTSSEGWRDGSCCDIENLRFTVYGTPVPEPSTFGILGAAFVALMLQRRRRLVRVREQLPPQRYLFA